MRKLLIVVVMLPLLAAVNLFSFEQGAVNAGGSVSFSSYKSYSDAHTTTTLSFFPQMGYFFIDNISGDLLLQCTAEFYDVGSIDN